MQENQAVGNIRRTLSTIRNLPGFFPAAGLTIPSVQGHIFKSEDRYDSKGHKIPGNGLAATGAIIRRGRKVLIDVDKYAEWLSGESAPPLKSKGISGKSAKNAQAGEVE